MYQVSEIKEIRTIDKVNLLLKKGWVLLEICSTLSEMVYVLGRLSNQHCDSRGCSEGGVGTTNPLAKN